jgi:hypothetical protein
MRQHLIRHGTAAALCATAVLGLTACQGKGGDSSGTDSSSPGRPSVTATPPPTRALLTGTQLTKVLAPASFFSSGFSIDPSNTQDTGGSYQDSSDDHPAKPDCAKLDTNSWIQITGMTGVSFTQQDRVNGDHSAEVAQEVDVFKDTAAATALSRVRTLGAACTSFVDSTTRSKVHVSEKALPGIGDAAYAITLTSPGWQTGSTLIAARVGTAVISVFSGDDSGHNGRTTAEKVVLHIADGLKGKA